MSQTFDVIIFNSIQLITDLGISILSNPYIDGRVRHE